MALDAILAILPTIAEYTFVPIKRHLGYTFNYKSKAENLKNQVQKLQGQRDGLLQEVDAATRRGDAIKDDVQQWLNKVNEAIQKADQELINGEEPAKEKCFYGLIPNLKAQHRLGRKAAKEDPEFTKLQEEGRFDRISYRPALTPLVGSSTHGNEMLHSRASMLKNVMDALMDPSVSMVGVCGTGGIGKTTLAKEVRRQSIEAKLFNVVVLTHVSETPDLKNIQENIADMLGLQFGEKTVEGRAHRLSQRLTLEKKVLIILDDVWKELDLESVGIPFGSDQQGCKILVTSRNGDVLSQKMGTQKTFELGILSEVEALSLFEKTTGEVADQMLATEIAKKCAGLPVLVVTVAVALKNKGLEAWKVALKELSGFDNKGFQEKVYSALELSYRHLGSEEVKSFFLLCAQLAQNDIPFPYLVTYSMGLGLLRHTETVEDGRNKVLKLINDLKAACLLLDGDRYGFVKMHDVIRDAAVLIASTTQRAFTFRDEIGLNKLPNKDVHGNCTRIYLPRSEIHEFPERLECPEAELFVLGTGRIYEKDTYSKIPNSFFEGITKLKVVQLNGMCLWSLPSSFDSLTNLRTLYLEDCALGDTGIIGKLKRLEVLSFRGSNINQLSRDIGKLTELKLLCLNECFSLKTIPANVISRLSLLEELYMRHSFRGWEIEGADGQGNASLAELKLLSHLTTLVIDVPDTKMLPKDLFSDKLVNYRITIGCMWYTNEKDFFSRALELKLDSTNIHLDHGVQVLLKGTEHLSLYELKGIRSLLYELDWEGFLQLKHLEIHDGHDIHYVICSTEKVPCNVFPILESLVLRKLITLENISNCQLTACSFSKLRTLKVENCNKLKNLLSFSMVRNLSQLQELEVSNCKGMEEIVSGESEVKDKEAQVVDFPQLRFLTLRCLPMFRGFCSKVKELTPSQLESYQRTKEIVSEEDELQAPLPFFDKRAFFPNLEVLTLVYIACQVTQYGEPSLVSSNLTRSTVSGGHDMKYIFFSSFMNNLLQLKKLEVYSCEFLEGIVLTEFGQDESMMKNILPNLHVLNLYNLPNLKRFCDGNFIEFPTLIELSISRCPALKTFISNPLSASTAASKGTTGLDLEKNQSSRFPPFFDEKVAFPSLEHMDISSMSNLERAWDNQLSEGSFCKLKSMNFTSCEILQTVFPSNHLARFLRLENLVVNFCESLQEIYQLPVFSDEESNSVLAFELRYLHIDGLCKLKHIWSKDPQGIFTFKNLQSVHVRSCISLNSLFPISIAKDLLQLERVDLSSSGVEALVEKIEGIEAAPSFVFPQLLSLELERLTRLRCFYPEVHSLQFPKLKHLRLVKCGQAMEFASEFLTFHRNQHNNPVQQSFLMAKKVFLNLEKLTLDGPVMEMISQCQLSLEHLSSVKYVEWVEIDELVGSLFLFGFMQRLSNLETLYVRDSDVRELTRYEGYHSKKEDDNMTVLLPRIRNLELVMLGNLTYIWKQDYSQMNYMLEYLQSMKVFRCHSLIYLAPSSVTLGSLTTLEVYDCKSLQHLLTSSTAKSMVHLTKMKISFCKMLEDIITDEADETAEEIVFTRLNTLELFHSQSLTSFCLGSFNFKFPSLEIVIVYGCPNMRTFSAGTSTAPKLQCVHLGLQPFRKWLWEGTLSSTFQKLYTDKVN
ncbi:probable disease resistance protein At4g27220 [Euphorbia lathyris]|uniref:probable disease resistance protein At4g27220 n=1 Tax=Euphorbia lathyris TaxID=212925 RepID=UPI0033134CB3